MAPPPPGHRALASALGLALGPAVALGLARFAYALILPAMQAHERWTYTQAGALNTASALGYLLGAVTAASVARRTGNRRAFLLGLLLTSLTLAATGLSSHFLLLITWRFLGGTFGALTFVTGGALAAHAATHLTPARGALTVGLYYGGVGLGIAASGLILPGYLAHTGPEGWPGAWWITGGIALACTLAAWRTTPGEPERAATDKTAATWRSLAYWPTLAAYFLFGAGYVSYMTFIIAFLRGSGTGPTTLSAFWVTLGAAVVASSWVWRRPMQHWPARRLLPTVMLILAVATVLPILTLALPATLASAVLFGATFLAVVSAITALTRRTLPGSTWTAALGVFTTLFSLGQVLGPILTGALADLGLGLRTGLAASAALLVVGAAVAALQRETPPGGT